MYSDNSDCSVTVFIPTAATKKRFPALKRAVYSVRKSSSKPLKIIVVVNGDSYCDEAVDWIKSQHDIRYVYEKMPSQANAALIARGLVDTPFFSTLDDDDEYLESATDTKLNELLAHPEADLVVTNGYFCRDNFDSVLYKNFTDASKDPLRYLFKFNWLHNCNALYRTESIGVDFFVDPHLNIEWTWLAYKMSLAKKNILFLDKTTFRFHDTPGSLSKSEAYMNAHMPLCERMLRKNPPQDVVRLIRERMSMDWHCRSDRALQAGRYGEALSSHLRSLFLPGGSRFLLYSRRLIPFWPGKKS